jgi:hypothetical protein
LNDLAISSPVEIVLLGALRSECANKEEKRLHSKLAAHRIKGEWFRAEAVLAEMKALTILAPEQIFKIESSRDTRSGFLHFRVAVEELRAWRREAKKARVSLSEWLRQLANADALSSSAKIQ